MHRDNLGPVEKSGRTHLILALAQTNACPVAQQLSTLFYPQRQTRPLSLQRQGHSCSPARHRQPAEGFAALGVCDNPPAHTAGCLSTHTYINKTAVREMAGKGASPKYSCPSYDNLQWGGRWKIQSDFLHTTEVSFATPEKQNLPEKHSW